MTIFGISLGTSRVGICILEDGVLLDRQVHDFPTSWSEHKRRVIINRLKQYLKKYKVDAIVVKVPPADSHEQPLKQLMKRLHKLSLDYGCAFDYMTKSEIKEYCRAHSTKGIILFTKKLYPELQGLYKKTKDKEYRFHKRLFEAAIAAHMYNEKIK